jgi:hypothetical protein
VSGQLHAPAALPPSGTHCIGGWVGPRTGLHDVERRKIFAPYRDSVLRPFGPPASSQSLLLVSCLAYSSSLKMEAICSSAASGPLRSTQRIYCNPEDRTLHGVGLLWYLLVSKTNRICLPTCQRRLCAELVRDAVHKDMFVRHARQRFGVSPSFKDMSLNRNQSLTILRFVFEPWPSYGIPNRTRHIGNWICFRPQEKIWVGPPAQGGPLGAASRSQWSGDSLRAGTDRFRNSCGLFEMPDGSRSPQP